MALTFTGAVSAATGGREEVRTLLVGALTCNVAWGVVDATTYLIECLVQRGRAWRVASAFVSAKEPAAARAAVAEALPPAIARGVGEGELEAMRAALVRSGLRPGTRGVTRRDLRGALGIFLLVTLSTFPVVIPFLVTQDAVRGLRWSNAVAVTMLCFVGAAFGKAAGLRPWLCALAMVLLGCLLVGLTIALGG
jgi:VIT1/CCC1 family predicted Fe2+/Mn2+ transporter